jgi:STIP1 homology and U-box containing protein 1
MTSLYTNRAMCRFNLKDYDGVVADCTACIDADPSSVKANYYLSKALSALGDHQTACAKAIEAYELCRHSDSDKSLVMTHDWLLRCKSERWRDAERRRVREHRDLENEVLALLVKDRDENVAAVAGDDEMEKTAIREESESKMAQIRDVFERARKEDDKKREVPEWLIDDITFDVMTDPIIVCSNTPRPPGLRKHGLFY